MKAAKKAKASLRLQREKPLAKEIRRVARAQIDAACRILASDEEPRHAVHEARKALKKIRAILRLVAPEFGRKPYRVEKRLFQDAARLLAPLRDAEARVKSLDALLQLGKLEPGDFSKVRETLEAVAERLAREANLPKSRAVEILGLARRRVRRWPLGELEWKDLVKEIRRAYRKGRTCLELYQQEQTAETFHAWRKRVKELWYHLRIVEDLLPEAVAKQIDLFGEIGEIAGNARDLAMLRETLSARKADVETALLIGEIDVRLPELQQAATERGVRLYADKPGVFAKRLA